MLGTHYILQHRIIVLAETEYNKRLPEYRVLRVEGKDLQRQVRAVSIVDQVLKLIIHHQFVTDPAPQDRFIEHDRQLQSVAVEHLLTTHADRDQPPDHAGRNRLDPRVAADYVPGISFRLEEARDDVDMPDGHGRRLVLQADELLIVVGQAF